MRQGRIDPDAFNAFEAAGWEDRALAYDRFFGSTTSQAVEPLLDAASVAAGTRVLDIATGPGYVAGEAARRGASVVGVDVAAAMVALARRLHPGLEFREADAHALPFEDASFDAVVGNFAILHLGRPEEAVAEFARTLAPGGTLALTVWDRPERARFVGVMLDAVAEAGATPPQDVPMGPDFFRFSVDEEFDDLSVKAGSRTAGSRRSTSPTGPRRRTSSGTVWSAGQFGCPRWFWDSRKTGGTGSGRRSTDGWRSTERPRASSFRSRSSSRPVGSPPSRTTGRTRGRSIRPRRNGPPA
jgi:SAM-dependent methyltransferase